uniref:Uncharacterized protein n=1 Tax=Rhizophora mucronata TaxID=61149 RepID=A0A2P2PRS3_RHIMU
MIKLIDEDGHQISTKPGEIYKNEKD